MNLYALLPLTAFIANVIIGCYIIYKNPKDRLNRLYALVAFSVAIWGLGDFLVFTAVTPAAALYWEKLSTLGSVSVPVLLLHFFLVFTRSKFVSRKIFYLLYIPSLLFGFLNFTTTLIPDSAELNYWGYGIAGGVLYEPFTSYIVVYIIAGLLFCYRFYSKAPSVREKSQAKLLMISIAIPLVGGVITEAVPIILGFKIIPLSSTLSAPTALIIAYAMIKYKLMTITSALAAENIIETMADYLVVADKEKNIALVSDSTIDILGYKRGEIVSKPMNIQGNRTTQRKEIFEEQRNTNLNKGWKKNPRLNKWFCYKGQGLNYRICSTHEGHGRNQQTD